MISRSLLNKRVKEINEAICDCCSDDYHVCENCTKLLNPDGIYDTMGDEEYDRQRDDTLTT